MPVIFGAAYVRREPRAATRCARCGAPTAVAFEQRPPCACGSRAWTTGTAMAWPPFALGREVSPWYLMGEMPHADAVPPPEHDPEDARAAARRVGRRGRRGYTPEPVSHFEEV